MKPTTSLLAEISRSARAPPMALLPPIPLYRRLLRAHRRLPSDMRFMGDKYVKAEFRAHRAVENPVHIVGFLTEWQKYAQMLEGDRWKDGIIDEEKIAKMSDQQLGQMYELMMAIKKRDAEGGDTEEGGNGQI